MSRRPFVAVWLGFAALGCNFIVGIDDLPPTPADASSPGSDVGLDAQEGGSSPDSHPLDSTTLDSTTLDSTTLDSTTSDSAADAADTILIGVVVQGLAPGDSVALQDNGGDTLQVPTNGTFHFAAPVALGDTYAVTVFKQPTMPPELCTVGSNGSGVATQPPVVTVACDTAVEVAGGSDFTCALMASGAVDCWGDNTQGQLGNGTTSNSGAPVSVGLTGATAIALGSLHACAIAGGAVHCWGNNQSGQLGNGTVSGPSSNPVQIPGLSGPTAIAAGGSHTCAILTNGAVECWGDNAQGDLGNGKTTLSSSPVEVSLPASDAGSGAIAIAAGNSHTCAVLAAGTVACWGQNASGQLGVAVPASSSTPILVPAVSGARSIAAGFNHSCALGGGVLHCWGANGNGEIGNGSTGPTSAPAASTLSQVATDVTCGDQFTCAALADQTVACWGYNGYEQLGDGLGSPQKSPEPVSSLTGALAVAAGDSHACALLDGGAIECWGSNAYGQLGDGTPSQSSTPQQVNTLASPLAIVAGSGDHVCAVLQGGTVDCWGLNTFGQLGNGGTIPTNAPGAVPGLTGVTQVVVGSNHTCALLTAGTVDCWGTNTSGQLGGVPGALAASPQAVPGLSGVVSLSSGQNFVCARLAGGGVDCWGLDTDGQLGTGPAPSDAGSEAGTTDGGSSRAPVMGLAGATAISAGYAHACALSGGGVECWGLGTSGQLGNGSIANSNVPVAVLGLGGVATAVAAGYDHTCALLASGSVDCWGSGGTGELGNGATVQESSAVVVQGLTDATAIAVGNSHSCALLASGAVECWGWNAYGQVGSVTATSTQKTPVVVSLPGPATAITAGQYDTCALLGSGAAYCWGWEGYGQLGNGTVALVSTPQPVQ